VQRSQYQRALLKKLAVYFIHTGLLDYSWMQLVQNAAAEKEMIQFLPVEKKQHMLVRYVLSMAAGLNWFNLVLCRS